MHSGLNSCRSSADLWEVNNNLKLITPPSIVDDQKTIIDNFEEAVKIGVQKININSDMRKAYRETLEKVLEENKSQYAVVKLDFSFVEDEGKDSRSVGFDVPDVVERQITK